MGYGFGFGLHKHRFVGGSGFEGMLDLFPNGSFAASIRKLKANYLGDSTTVRRDNSDQLGIGFANNELNEPELVTFADGGDAFNVDFKDQTGNGRNFSQGSAASQPKIVSNGTVIKANTKPTLSYDGTNDHLRCPATDFVTATNKLQVSVVCKNNSTNVDNQIIIAQYDSDNSQRSWAFRFFNGVIEIIFGTDTGSFSGGYRASTFISPENLNSLGFTFDSGVVVLYANGSVIDGREVNGTVPTLLFDSNADVRIALWEGDISEAYVADNLTDSIVEIQQNQMEYFNIN